MSHEATLWAWKAPVQTATQRLVLLSLADRADEQAQAWPSVKRLEKDTLLNRKTVMRAIEALESCNLLADTAHRKGPTKSVIVWQLVGVVLRETGKPTTAAGCITREQRNSTKIGIAKKAVPKTVLDKEAVPKLDMKLSQNRDCEQYQNRDCEQYQNRDIESVIEPINEPDTDTDAKAVSAVVSIATLPHHLEENNCHPIIFRFLGTACSNRQKTPAKVKLWSQITSYGFDSKYVQSALNKYWLDNMGDFAKYIDGLPDEDDRAQGRKAIFEWEVDSSEAIEHANGLLRKWRESCQ